MSISEPWAAIISYWRRCGILIRQGVTSESIKAFEEKYHVALPYDFAEYLQAVDGTGKEEFDENLLTFWPLSEIRPVHEVLGVRHSHQCAHPNFFVFADWSLDCWLYAIQITSDASSLGPVCRIAESEVPGQMEAASFREFMTKHATAPGIVV